MREFNQITTTTLPIAARITIKRANIHFAALQRFQCVGKHKRN